MKTALLLFALHFCCWGAVAPTHNQIMFTIAGTACIASIIMKMDNKLFTLYVSAPVTTYRLVRLQFPSTDIVSALKIANSRIENDLLNCDEANGPTLTIDQEEHVCPMIRGNGDSHAIYLEDQVRLSPNSELVELVGEPHDADPGTQAGFVWSQTAGGRTAFNYLGDAWIRGGKGFVIAVPTSEKTRSVFEDMPSREDVFAVAGRNWKIIFCFDQ